MSPTRTLAGEHGDSEPQWDRPVDDDGGDRHDEQQTVDRRVEHLAELADLAEAAGEVAVDPVGGAEGTEDQRGGDLVVEAEQQPEEHRQAQEPHQREQVRAPSTSRRTSTAAPRR